MGGLPHITLLYCKILTKHNRILSSLAFGTVQSTTF
jgi:hypothetical protein